jgi:hypothetical protein
LRQAHFGFVAAMLRAEPADVLLWLRAGLPYIREGDWDSGEGFGFIASAVIDWILLTSWLARATGDTASVAALRLPFRDR